MVQQTKNVICAINTGIPDLAKGIQLPSAIHILPTRDIESAPESSVVAATPVIYTSKQTSVSSAETPQMVTVQSPSSEAVAQTICGALPEKIQAAPEAQIIVVPCGVVTVKPPIPLAPAAGDPGYPVQPVVQTVPLTSPQVRESQALHVTLASPQQQAEPLPLVITPIENHSPTLSPTVKSVDQRLPLPALLRHNPEPRPTEPTGCPRNNKRELVQDVSANHLPIIQNEPLYKMMRISEMASAQTQPQPLQPKLVQPCFDVRSFKQGLNIQGHDSQQFGSLPSSSGPKLVPVLSTKGFQVKQYPPPRVEMPPGMQRTLSNNHNSKQQQQQHNQAMQQGRPRLSGAQSMGYQQRMAMPRPPPPQTMAMSTSASKYRRVMSDAQSSYLMSVSHAHSTLVSCINTPPRNIPPMLPPQMSHNQQSTGQAQQPTRSGALGHQPNPQIRQNSQTLDPVDVEYEREYQRMQELAKQKEQEREVLLKKCQEIADVQQQRKRQRSQEEQHHRIWMEQGQPFKPLPSNGQSGLRPQVPVQWHGQDSGPSSAPGQQVNSHANPLRPSPQQLPQGQQPSYILQQNYPPNQQQIRVTPPQLIQVPSGVVHQAIVIRPQQTMPHQQRGVLHPQITAQSPPQPQQSVYVPIGQPMGPPTTTPQYSQPGIPQGPSPNPPSYEDFVTQKQKHNLSRSNSDQSTPSPQPPPAHLKLQSPTSKLPSGAIPPPAHSKVDNSGVDHRPSCISPESPLALPPGGLSAFVPRKTAVGAPNGTPERPNHVTPPHAHQAQPMAPQTITSISQALTLPHPRGANSSWSPQGMPLPPPLLISSKESTSPTEQPNQSPSERSNGTVLADNQRLASESSTRGDQNGVSISGKPRENVADSVKTPPAVTNTNPVGSLPTTPGQGDQFTAPKEPQEPNEGIAAEVISTQLPLSAAEIMDAVVKSHITNRDHTTLDTATFAETLNTKSGIYTTPDPTAQPRLFQEVTQSRISNTTRQLSSSVERNSNDQPMSLVCNRSPELSSPINNAPTVTQTSSNSVGLTVDPVNARSDVKVNRPNDTQLQEACQGEGEQTHPSSSSSLRQTNAFSELSHILFDKEPPKANTQEKLQMPQDLSRQDTISEPSKTMEITTRSDALSNDTSFKGSPAASDADVGQNKMNGILLSPVSENSCYFKMPQVQLQQTETIQQKESCATNTTPTSNSTPNGSPTATVTSPAKWTPEMPDVVDLTNIESGHDVISGINTSLASTANQALVDNSWNGMRLQFNDQDKNEVLIQRELERAIANKRRPKVGPTTGDHRSRMVMQHKIGPPVRPIMPPSTAVHYQGSVRGPSKATFQRPAMPFGGAQRYPVANPGYTYRMRMPNNGMPMVPRLLSGTNGMYTPQTMYDQQQQKHQQLMEQHLHPNAQLTLRGPLMPPAVQQPSAPPTVPHMQQPQQQFPGVHQPMLSNTSSFVKVVDYKPRSHQSELHMPGTLHNQPPKPMPEQFHPHLQPDRQTLHPHLAPGHPQQQPQQPPYGPGDVGSSGQLQPNHVMQHSHPLGPASYPGYPTQLPVQHPQSQYQQYIVQGQGNPTHGPQGPNPDVQGHSANMAQDAHRASATVGALGQGPYPPQPHLLSGPMHNYETVRSSLAANSMQSIPHGQHQQGVQAMQVSHMLSL